MPLIPKAKPKPKNGEWLCKQCDALIDGKFSEDDTIFCYLCGSQMLVKDMVKIAKPKEVKVKPLNSGISGTFITYDYGPGGEVSNLSFNGVPYKGKKI